MKQPGNLGRSSLVVPPMGVGVMTWGDARGLVCLHPSKTGYGGPESSQDEKLAFEASLAAGINFFDTAALYGGGASERRLGGLAQGREVVIASKFPSSFFFRLENFTKELDASLQRLNRNSVDLYQHHFPSDRISLSKLMELMAEAVQAGKIKAVGVSNYSAKQMRKAHAALGKLGIPLASNQVEYSLLHRRPERDGVLDACRELGITLIAYQPPAGGALTGKYLSNLRPKGIRRFAPDFRGKGLEKAVSVVRLLQEIGKRYGKNSAQVAIRWLIEQENVLPIPGAKSEQQAAANAGGLTFSLTLAELEALDQATRPADDG